jgi:hypothetical protein
MRSTCQNPELPEPLRNQKLEPSFFKQAEEMLEGAATQTQRLNPQATDCGRASDELWEG